MHYISFYNRVERGVHSWRREDDDGLESKDSRQLSSGHPTLSHTVVKHSLVLCNDAT